jgi:uncharacterized delta-60 repeat protein
MYKFFSVAVLILILNTSCSLIKEQDVFNYDSYNISHNKFDFGFYEIPQSFAISKKCEIYITGTTSKQDDPTDYLMIKMNKDLNLDNSFSQEGKAMFDIDAGLDEGNQILLLNDESFIIGGRSNHGVGLGMVLFDYSLAKFNSKGENIKSFGETGKVITDFGYRDDAINKMILNKDGTFFAIGRANNGKDDDFAVAKYKPNGDLDYSFNKIGRVTIDFGLSDDVAYSAVKTDKGELIIGGSSNSGATPKVAFAKINAEGKLVDSFGQNGLKVWKFSPPGLIYDLDIIGQDIYASGFIDNLVNFNILVTKFDVDGIIDEDFGKRGTRIFSDILTDSVSTSLVVINENQILLAGTIKNDDNEDASLIMIDNKGNFDNSFADNGIYKLNYGKNEIFTDVIYFKNSLYSIGLHYDEDEGDVIVFKMHKSNISRCD